MYFPLHVIISAVEIHPFQRLFILFYYFINYIFPLNRILIYNSLFSYYIYIIILIMIYLGGTLFEGENNFNFPNICRFYRYSSWCRIGIRSRNKPIFHSIWIQKLFWHINLWYYIHNNVYYSNQLKHKI